MTLVWIPVIAALVVAAWYAFEGAWNRRLFTAAPDCVCANLKAAQAKAYLRDHPETQVLDVRSPDEFRGGALPNAVNIPLGDAGFDAQAAVLDKDKPVMVYCAGGFRSRRAVDRLKQLGFRNIQHIHRGYLSWKSDPET